MPMWHYQGITSDQSRAALERAMSERRRAAMRCLRLATLSLLLATVAHGAQVALQLQVGGR